MAGMQHVFILLLVYCILMCTAAQDEDITKSIDETKKECIKGQIYKIDCNTCHCTSGSTFVCTKMACVRMPGLKKGNLRISAEGCSPGTFYKKDCSRCFCNNYNKLLCGPEDCQTVDKLPETYKEIHTYSSHSPADRHLLPSLPHQVSQCYPGSAYRVGCNTCLCLANGNLHCSELLCPSHEDVHLEKAKNMSGLPCDTIGVIHPSPMCLQCWCVDRATVCQPKADCVSPRHTNTPLDLRVSSRKCKPGTTYRKACNHCYCTSKRHLHCTMKNCLSREQTKRLDRIRNRIGG